MVEEPKEDSVADALTVIDLTESGSSNSSSTYCIHRYFGPCNRQNNSNGNSSDSSGVSDLVNDNGSIQM